MRSAMLGLCGCVLVVVAWLVLLKVGHPVGTSGRGRVTATDSGAAQVMAIGAATMMVAAGLARHRA